MKPWQGKHRFVLAAILLWLLYAPASLANEPVVLIAHPGISTDSINKDRLRAIFAMRETRWPDGTAIRVVVLPDQNPVHRVFCKQPLAIYPFILRRHWDRLTFTGTGTMPVSVGSEAEMLKTVSQTPGALGYVRQSSRTEAVKILTITQSRRDQGEPRP